MTISAAPASVGTWSQSRAQALPAALLGLSAAALLAAGGGFYPTSWGFAAIGLAWGAVVVGAVRGRARPSSYELVYLGGLTAFLLWLVVSMAWTESPTGTPLEIERTLVYGAVALAGIVVVRHDQMRVLLGGVCAGAAVICAYSLATRLFPDRFAAATFEPQRLSGPVGYWNGLGIVAVMGVLLALGLAARARSWPGRALAGAAVPVFLATLYFTFGRGSWAALVVGLVVLLVFDRRRVPLALASLPLAAIGAVVVWEASRSTALTHTDATLAAASHAGHRLALIVLGACLVSAAVAVAGLLVERRGEITDRAHRIVSLAMIGVVVVALVPVFVHYGSPVTLVRRGYHAFASNPVNPTDLNSRLFNLSSNGRLDEWRVALNAFEAHPVGGIGAGAYANYWAQHRPTGGQVLDAHNLYLETLAEAGIVGLVLLVTALAAPLVGFWRARRRALSGAALAAYVAYLVGAAADWDWELAGVTVVALLCGSALLAAGRDGGGRSFRILPLAFGTVLALAALYGLVGNLAISRASSALAGGNLELAASRARTAEFWAPWSAEPWQALGDAQLSLGQTAAARASLLTAISKDPRDELLWLDLARATGGKEQAAALDRAHLLNPRDSTVALLRQQLHGRPAFSGGH